MLFSNSPICFFIRKLIDQNHIEDGKTNGDGEQEDLLAEETCKEKKASSNGQPSITESNENLSQTMVRDSKRFARIKKTKKDAQSS